MEHVVQIHCVLFTLTTIRDSRYVGFYCKYGVHSPTRIVRCCCMLFLCCCMLRMSLQIFYAQSVDHSEFQCTHQIRAQISKQRPWNVAKRNTKQFQCTHQIRVQISKPRPWNVAKRNAKHVFVWYCTTLTSCIRVCVYQHCISYELLPSPSQLDYRELRCECMNHTDSFEASPAHNVFSFSGVC